MARSNAFGTESILKLLIQQATPASFGFLIMSVYTIVDTIYVGRFIGSLAIAAVTVVTPITFLISSFGMAIGVGGASVISRALGAQNREKALDTFGNQINLTLHLSLGFMVLGFIFNEEILFVFGAKGDIMPLAREYFTILLYGVPFLAWAMMSNNVIRAQGRPKIAMYTMIIPAVVNIILDPVFIIALDMGMAGAAWATTISYFLSAVYTLYFFLRGTTELTMHWRRLKLKWSLIAEILSIGMITFARQGSVSLLAIVVNHSLYSYAGEMGIAVYGIVNRTMMFALFPIIGIVQGFLPIVGYNYGAMLNERVRLSISTSMKIGLGLATIILAIIVLFSDHIVMAFTEDAELIAESSDVMIQVFLATPLAAIQMIGAAYFQAIGKAMPALLLTLTRQGFFLIPLVLLLPKHYGENGIWYSFPIADFASALITYLYLRWEIRTRLSRRSG